MIRLSVGVSPVVNARFVCGLNQSLSAANIVNKSRISNNQAKLIFRSILALGVVSVRSNDYFYVAPSVC